MNKIFRNILYGFLVWLIPFVISIFFYSREGTLSIDIFVFKTIMIVVGSIVGAIFLVSYFKKISGDYLKEGIILGVVWFGINIVLDLIILVPMSKIGIWDYFVQTGLRYLSIPAMSIAIGSALGRLKK